MPIAPMFHGIPLEFLVIIVQLVPVEHFASLGLTCKRLLDKCAQTHYFVAFDAYVSDDKFNLNMRRYNRMPRCPATVLIKSMSAPDKTLLDLFGRVDPLSTICLKILDIYIGDTLVTLNIGSGLTLHCVEFSGLCQGAQKLANLDVGAEIRCTSTEECPFLEGVRSGHAWNEHPLIRVLQGRPKCIVSLRQWHHTLPTPSLFSDYTRPPNGSIAIESLELGVVDNNRREQENAAGGFRCVEFLHGLRVLDLRGMYIPIISLLYLQQLPDLTKLVFAWDSVKDEEDVDRVFKPQDLWGPFRSLQVLDVDFAACPRLKDTLKKCVKLCNEKRDPKIRLKVGTAASAAGASQDSSEMPNATMSS